MNREIKILFIADIIGPHGLDIVASLLPKLVKDKQADLVVANGENAKNGRGLDDTTATRLFKMGIHVITGGNHIWQRQKYFNLLNTDPNILRPLNYPSESPGHGTCIFETGGQTRIGIINLQGRSFLYPIDCPFKSASAAVSELKKQGIQCIFIDFHAEATAEKIALAHYLDGQISALVGTHTHVQTADDKILPKGTAYLTDAGMTGPHRSVIGMNTSTAIERFINQLPVHYMPASPVDLQLNGAYIVIDEQSGMAKSIERLQLNI
ncbi:TIGR00282 family metallophosphoesterase [bacterium]|nr:TIGR00282 family metallophosphoesterase [bacterium]